jgi:osmotically-inducible protein OsmY
MIPRTALVVLLALPGMIAATPLTASGAQQRPAAILAEVGSALRGELDLRRIDYRVDGAEVTLSGEVPTLWVKSRAIDRVLEIEGVDTVASELTIPTGEDDDAIAGAVGSAIRQYRYYTIWDYVGGGVVDGVVTLTGSVTPDRDKPAELFDRIARIPGVQDVVLELFVQSASRRDRDLRLLIAQRVRRHPVFAQYLLLPDSPFRILVHEGEVLLVGSVRSGVEKRVIEQIARQAFETEQVINRLQVGGG